MVIQTPAQLAKKYGIRPNKKLGQNFINRIEILEQIVDELEINENDLVCEFGSGPGTIAAIAFKRGAKVIGIEKDEKMVEIAKTEFPEIEFICTDMREWEPLNCKTRTINDESRILKIVGNLPYYLTSFFLRKFLDWNYSAAVFMIQKEVGVRILSKPRTSEYGFLSVVSQGKAKIEKLFTVGRSSFYPNPNVDSIVLKFTPINIGWSKMSEEIASLAFEHRRQTIFKSLKKKYDEQKLINALKLCSIAQNQRPQELSPSNYIDLAKYII